MALSTELCEALARSRRRPRLRGRTVNQEGGTRAPLLQENSDTVPAEDPDDSVDPDDSGTKSECCRSALRAAALEGVADGVCQIGG